VHSYQLKVNRGANWGVPKFPVTFSCCVQFTTSQRPSRWVWQFFSRCNSGDDRQGHKSVWAHKFIRKLLLRFLWFFWRTAALFRQIHTFPQFFRFCSDLGNFGIWQIVRNSMLTGRWWDSSRERRTLINLCGKNNVRNCDLLQSDFFDRCSQWGEFWKIETFHRSKFSPATGVTFCGPTGGGKWSQQRLRSILTREVHIHKSNWNFHRYCENRLVDYGVFFLAANLVRFWVITTNTVHWHLCKCSSWDRGKKFWKFDFFKNSQILIFRISKKSIW